MGLALRTAGALLLAAAVAAGGESLAWRTDLAAALAESKQEGRPVLVAFFVPYAGRDVEKGEPGLLTEAVRKELAGFVLLKADLLAHPEWRRNDFWKLPRYLFLDSGGTVLHEHNDNITPGAFDGFRRSVAEIKALRERTAAPAAACDDWGALARWHAARFNRADAAAAFRKAASKAPDPAREVPLLLEMSRACSDRFAPTRDEPSARWALARILELDPEGKLGFSGKADLRGIEVTLEAGRLEDGAREAGAFLDVHPQAEEAGEVLVRRIWAQVRLGDYGGALKSLAARKGYRIDVPTEAQCAESSVRVLALRTQVAAADAEPARFDACLRYLQAVHDDPPKGHWVRYLRRAAGAADAPGEKVPGVRLALADALAATGDEGRAEAKGIVEDLLAKSDGLDEVERRRAEGLRDLLKEQPPK